MDHGMISKIQKAKRYAQERDRFEFNHFSVTFKGSNNDHQITFENGSWHCDCEFFMKREVCSHTMAIERLLVDMLPEGTLTPTA